MALSEATVRTHLSHIYTKVGVRGRVDLLARLQGDGTPPADPPQVASMTIPSSGPVALVTGCAVAVVGLGAYQAWWTIIFALGGFAVFLLTERRASPARAMLIGSAIAGSALLFGMGLFLLYGSSFGGGTPWLVGSISSIVSAVLLLVVARRLMRPRTT